jgi:hypothetical protein
VIGTGFWSREQGNLRNEAGGYEFHQKHSKRSAIILVTAFALIQLAPVDRVNPAVETEVRASAEVRLGLRRGCYDCHSKKTVWPWFCLPPHPEARLSSVDKAVLRGWALAIGSAGIKTKRE